MSGPSHQEQAFVELVDRYLDRVFRYLRNLTRDDERARELSHETFIRLKAGLASRGSLSEAYVFTAARNTALSAWRRHQSESRKQEELEQQEPRGGRSTSEFDGAVPSVTLERKELRQALEHALGVLPEDQRSVFLLSEVEGLKYEEIGRIMDVSSGTVASRKHHAIRALRRELERTGHALP